MIRSSRPNGPEKDGPEPIRPMPSEALRPKEDPSQQLLPRRVIQWLSVIATLAILGGIGAVAGAASGVIDVSAVAPHPYVWARFLHFASSRSLAMHAEKTSPSEPLDSPALVMLGAAQYALVCASCHGAPGFGQSPIALSMRPEPPPIIDASRHLSDGELFHVVHDGVRYTAMPAWAVSNRPDEVWAMVAFLKALPTMSRETYLSLIHSSSGNGNNGVDATGAIAPAAVATSNRQGRPTIAPFIPSRREIPYLPGNPQDPYASAASVVSPRIGFGTLDATAADPMAACTNCHGSDLAGRHGGSFPNLTLQTPQYIYDSLKAFASGERQSGIMWPVAATLSDEQMRALASRIGGGGVTVSPADLKGAAAGSTERRRGEDVAASGLDKNGQPPVGAAGGSSEAPAVKVERCTSCHLPAADLDRIVPRIDGQNAAYLRQQLIAFRGGGRGDTSPYDPMTADSHNLSDADIRAVADYYASRPPIAKN